MNQPKSGKGKDRKLTPQFMLKIAVAIMAGLVLAGGLIAWQLHKDTLRREDLRAQADNPPTAADHVGGPFTLTDQNGRTVTEKKYRGKYMLVYFGYTYCPDLCPTGLQSIAHALDKLGDQGHKIQTLFITIDPARDTPKKLKAYVKSFHPDIVGLTGTPAQIADVAKEYKVYYAKGEMVEDGQYLMDHSSLIYLMGPRGQFVSEFPDDVDPATLTKALREVLAEAGKRPE